MTTPRPPKILFLTGTRADFGKLKPLMQRVEAAPEFELKLFVTGMHTMARYGSTYDEVRKCFSDFHLFINQTEGMSSSMDLVLANTVQGLGHYVREFRPDMIVVHGDRVEALAGAIVGILNNILVAHIEGGEVSGTVDELLRHSVSKLAHLHFVANLQAEGRLLQMGERAEHIFVIGSPDLDVMQSGELPSLTDVRARYEIPFQDYAIAVFHPVTTELATLRHDVLEFVAALRASQRNYVVVFPNSDAGAHNILEAYGELEQEPRMRLFPSIRFEYFLTLLKHAAFIIGNSSAGIREAPFYGVPTINIGTRQQGRATNASITNVPADRRSILDAIGRVDGRSEPSSGFGDGKSADRFMSALKSADLWAHSLQKQFKDLAYRGTPPPHAGAADPL